MTNSNGICGDTNERGLYPNMHIPFSRKPTAREAALIQKEFTDNGTEDLPLDATITDSEIVFNFPAWLVDDSLSDEKRIEAYAALHKQWKTKISNILKEGKNDRFKEIYRGDRRTTYERSRFHEADSTEGEERKYSNYRNNNFHKQILSEREGAEIRDFATQATINSQSKGMSSTENDDIDAFKNKKKKRRTLFNSNLLSLERKAIQDYIETLPNDTDTSNGLWHIVLHTEGKLKGKRFAYKFNTSLVQYADNRKDERDGFEILSKVEVPDCTDTEINELKIEIENGTIRDQRDVNSWFEKHREKQGMYSSDIIDAQKQRTDDDNDRLDKQTLQGEPDGRRSNRDSRSNQGTSEIENKRAISLLAKAGITLDNSLIDEFLKGRESNPYHQVFKQIVGILRNNNIPVNIVVDTEMEHIAARRQDGFKTATVRFNPRFLFHYLKEHPENTAKGNIMQIVTHELVHAVTAEILQSHPTWSKIRGFDKAQTKFNADIWDLYQQCKEQLKDTDWYGISNAKEFVAEALTNRDFQVELSRIKVGKETAYKRFINYITKLFNTIFKAQGINIENSALEKVISISEEYFEYANRGINRAFDDYHHEQDFYGTDNNNQSNTLDNYGTKEYKPTDEFRRIQEASRKLASRGVSEFNRGEKEFTDEDRERIGRVLERQLESASHDDRYEHESNLTHVNKDGSIGSFDIGRVEGKLFHDIFETVKTYLRNGELVDLHDDYSNCKCFVTADGLCGFAIEPDGNLVSVFSLSPNTNKGFLYAIKDMVRAEGATHLDAYASSNQP